MTGWRICTGPCGRWKPVSDFRPRKWLEDESRPLYIASECDVCHREKQRIRHTAMLAAAADTTWVDQEPVPRGRGRRGWPDRAAKVPRQRRNVPPTDRMVAEARDNYEYYVFNSTSWHLTPPQIFVKGDSNPFDAANECQHGALSTDKAKPAACNCW